jgi:hypothetical protein
MGQQGNDRDHMDGAFYHGQWWKHNRYRPSVHLPGVSGPRASPMIEGLCLTTEHTLRDPEGKVFAGTLESGLPGRNCTISFKVNDKILQ